MRTQVFIYRFTEDAEVEIWRHGKQSKKQYKKGDTIGVIGYADDEDKHCAGPYGHAGEKGFQYMGDSAKGAFLTGTLQDESIIELCRGSIELVNPANSKS
jgi:hypothetical protein